MSRPWEDQQTGWTSWIHLRPDLPSHIWWSPDCWWNPSCSWGHYPYLCCGCPWLPTSLSLQNVPALDAPGQLVLAFLSPEWSSWILVFTFCLPQPFQAEHHVLVLAIPNPVGGCGQSTEASCNSVGSVAHPALTVIPSVTTEWGYRGF